ncbi:hypothetical protein BMT54_12060, partial [Pasteurellaceae bacterium 15-036681]
YYAGSNKGGGYFIADLSDTTTADNSGIVIVTASGKRWKRIYTDVTPTPFDFGALGDDTADDSNAFAAIESAFFKNKINLHHHTFIVNHKPTRNFYYNGKLKVDNRYQQMSLPAYGVKWSKNAGEGFIIDELQPKVGSVATNSAGILQHIVYDYVNKHYYAQSVKSGTLTGGDELVVLTRYTRDGTTYLKSDIESAVSNKIGHQGLGLEYTLNGIKLWATAGSHYYPNNVHYALRFSPPNDGGDIAEIEEFKVWDSEKDKVRNYLSSSVAISPHGDLMCVFGIWDEQKQGRIRIFDMNVFSAGAGDYTDKWLYTWDLPDEYDGGTKPCQAVTTDGKFVYVLLGGDDVQVFTLDGHRVFKTNHAIGKKKCAELVTKGYTNSYEPESWVWMPTAGGFSLCMSVVMGYNWREGSWSEGKARYKNLIFSQVPFEVLTQQTAPTDNGFQTTGRIAALNNESSENGIFAYSSSAIGRRISYILSNKNGENNGASIALYSLDDSSTAAGSARINFSSKTQNQALLFDSTYSAVRPSATNLLSLGLNWATWKEIFVETPALDDDSKKVVNSSFVQRLLRQRDRSENGWLKIGDTIMQWGNATSDGNSGKVSFPIAFPNKLLFANVSETKGNISGSLYSFAWIKDASSQTELAWQSNGTAGAFSFFAVGY